MNRIVSLVGIALVMSMTATACAVGERPTLTQDTIRPNTTLFESGAAAADTLQTPDLEPGNFPTPAELGGMPPVVISPTGVVLPVLGPANTGFMVRTPCGVDVELPFGQAVREVDVVLDAGHGGDELGAVGPSGQTEAELNLDVVRRAASLLEQQGVSVVLTRVADYRITIPMRAAIADQLGAKIMVSVHHNSPTPESTGEPGAEVYTQVGKPESRRLGGLIHEEVLKAFNAFDIQWARLETAGVLDVIDSEGEDAYGITRRPGTPTVLAELAYISNPAEDTLLASVDYRQAAATAIAGAAVRYLQSEDAGSGFIEEPRLLDLPATTGGVDGCVDPLLS